MDKSEKEYILCASVWFDDGVVTYHHQPKNIKSGFVVSGRRHHNCFYTVSVFTEDPKSKASKSITQGFLTNTDRFVDRKEAAKIAFEAGQVPELYEQLISEHLY
ncbi:hypothetical protein [Arcicella rosea]|uniref:Uncharacterized protein n=1 Tax=Arcicella rosea TaxID=502909 RepID=A0A841ET85_9BACT|nr:hypothetical protein [Arcicella rosea]MBB6003878.1 hypothetical protein [Arcicella rosea]